MEAIHSPIKLVSRFSIFRFEDASLDLLVSLTQEKSADAVLKEKSGSERTRLHTKAREAKWRRSGQISAPLALRVKGPRTLKQ